MTGFSRVKQLFSISLVLTFLLLLLIVPAAPVAGASIKAVVAAPVIKSFTPVTGGTGTTVSISGTNLSSTTAVYFGATPAASFKISSNSKITATVGSGSSGKIAVTTSAGSTKSASNFTFAAAPSISSFTPAAGGYRTTVVINGTNLKGATSVKFGGTKAYSFTVNSPARITAVAGSGSTGKISVTTPGGTVISSTGFTFYSTPTISSFTPASAGQSAPVTITGTNLLGATAVSFGGKSAGSFTVDSNTKITAVVGTGASGKISLTTPGGTATSKNTFTFVGAPTISSFTPLTGQSGTSVTITGTNFGGATAVSFGGTPAGSFKVVSGARITAVVGSGSSGNISVTTPGGIAASSSAFTYQGESTHSITLKESVLPAPPIKGMEFHFIAPSAGAAGTAVARASYGIFGWNVYLGVTNGKLWVAHLPQREAVPAGLLPFYDNLGINEFTTYSNGKYWLSEMPEWMEISQFDPDLQEMPEFVSITTISGQMTITYKKD